MSGIHLPDIGKLGIHIATGMKDKKKVTPSNMAEDAKFRALSTRLDSEKHERSRALKKEERRMKRRKHKIDQRRCDIQKGKKEELHAANCDDSVKGTFPPLISYTRPSGEPNDELSRETKDVDQYSCSSYSPTSAIFPIQDEFLFFEGNREGRDGGEKQKFTLPPIEKDVVESKKKERKSTPFKKKAKKNNIIRSNKKIMEGDFEESSHPRNSKKRRQSTPLVLAQNVTSNNHKEDFVSSKEDSKVEIRLPSPTMIDGKETAQLTEGDEPVLQIESGAELGLDEANSSANPFNYLLVEAQRRKAINQNLQDAFRAIKACRYIRTPSRLEQENAEESTNLN